MSVTVGRSGKQITISQAIEISGREISEMRIQERDALTLTIKTSLNLEELVKLIDSEGPPDSPGWKGRIAEVLATEVGKNLAGAAVEAAKRYFQGS